MTPAQFAQWLTDMKSAGLATSDAHCGRLLGRTRTSVQNAKARGTDRVTALACTALLYELKPYGQA